MLTFIAVYRGASVSNAELVGVSADPAIVKRVAGELLAGDDRLADPVVRANRDGEKHGLRLIVGGAQVVPVKTIDQPIANKVA